MKQGSNYKNIYENTKLYTCITVQSALLFYLCLPTTVKGVIHLDPVLFLLHLSLLSHLNEWPVPSFQLFKIDIHHFAKKKSIYLCYNIFLSVVVGVFFWFFFYPPRLAEMIDFWSRMNMQNQTPHLHPVTQWQSEATGMISNNWRAITFLRLSQN